MLSRFAAKHGIEYPLLSDEGSRVIKQLGLYNEHLKRQAAVYGLTPREDQYGVPYPGSFVLDENGVIVDKRFEQSYRVRPQPADLLETAFAAEIGEAAVSDQASNDEIGATIWLNDAAYRPWQQLLLHLSIRIGDGLHIYGRPIPEGFYPLEIQLADVGGLETGASDLPAPHPYRVEGLDEQFMAYEGEIKGTLPFFITEHHGDLTLEVTISYQACTESECFPPSQLRLRLPVVAHENVAG